MKEIQIPRKNFVRSSDSRIKRPKDPDMKNRKVAEKRQNATFSDVSLEITKDPMDFTQITQVSGMLSDSEAESIVVQRSSQDLSSNPEICLPTDESPVEAHVDASSADPIQSNSDLSAFVQLRAEINELKKLIHPVDTCEEYNWIDEVVTVKFRIMLLSFILWAILAAFVVFFSSREEFAYYGPLPT